LSKPAHQAWKGLAATRHLLPCLPPDAALIASWPASSKEVADWCELDEFPLRALTVAGWNLDGVQPYILVEAGEIVGYGELWTDIEDDFAELGRIIVVPGARRRGVGRRLTDCLLRQARLASYTQVVLRVHPGNYAALRCGMASGFTPVDRATAQHWNEIQSIDYVWLQHLEGTP
jgi:ribosomal protein S18 acetylase RimI-like enzyme